MANLRLLLVLADSTLGSLIVDAFAGLGDVKHVTSLDEALVELRATRYVAVAWSPAEHPRSGAGFPELVRHLHPGVRMLSAHAHLVPHIVTLAGLRPRPVYDWQVRPRVSDALVDAMVASEDDPVFDGPHIN
ncbi:MAG: hypothetical protein R3B40_32040 [Polyangiales bacterium]|nr:hypothetical protein [Myxococcales bacterium]MCB9660342.1 hypothetical protein [Sandaracinaceae bacterium]